MIGIDIISIERIARLRKRYAKAFLQRFLSHDEIVLAKSDASLAGLWAAKEAASKALGVGISTECSFFDIMISKDVKNAPVIKFSDKIYKKFSIKNASLSISHDSGFAIAAVILEKNVF
ncbi:holo-ACP synthase [Campylobacter sp. faydin G-24]|uniref:Holo-[acyl-carrier-protein] synthase n=1 Tax=Campylobacter anatolicus TaxID=2829105 RepID=A0ABS5HHC1_9BACT|nr:holo-ACP synthase [Campylobacter anatolicus]MBR8462208.1 holo-ACP synthase [Campylobacter anatolicus]MBR8463675.1 holo-ACP synthase [Campylobacter anatolicus]MBR8466412.1 holo-ACP synthase [Campylobacter anatolicus]